MRHDTRRLCLRPHSEQDEAGTKTAEGDQLATTKDHAEHAASGQRGDAHARGGGALDEEQRQPVQGNDDAAEAQGIHAESGQVEG